jgi:hypothetical protein
MFEAPKEGQFTQGTIFSCAYAENYPDAEVYGLVITARCDAAQDKAQIYNFIPIVSLTDWMLFDGAEIALNRIRQDQLNTKNNILNSAELSNSLVRTKTTDQIINFILQPMAERDKKWTPKIQQFKSASELIETIQDSIFQNNGIAKQRIMSSFPKHVESVIRELATNRLLGHYLLRDVPNIDTSPASDYVALLREIHHIPNALAKIITKGIAKTDWHVEHTYKVYVPRFGLENDYCLPTGRLRSPWMEHLMQNLTMLFARIGVEDIDIPAIKKTLAAIGLEIQ